MMTMMLMMLAVGAVNSACLCSCKPSPRNTTGRGSHTPSTRNAHSLFQLYTKEKREEWRKWKRVFSLSFPLFPAPSSAFNAGFIVIIIVMTVPWLCDRRRRHNVCISRVHDSTLCKQHASTYGHYIVVVLSIIHFHSPGLYRLIFSWRWIQPTTFTQCIRRWRPWRCWWC